LALNLLLWWIFKACSITLRNLEITKDPNSKLSNSQMLRFLRIFWREDVFTDYAFGSDHRQEFASDVEY
jgi:hypothetical protein